MCKMKKIMSIFVVMAIMISSLPIYQAQVSAADITYAQSAKDSVPLRNKIGENNEIVSRIAKESSVVKVIDKQINILSLKMWYKVNVPKGITNDGDYGTYWVWGGNLTEHSHGKFSNGACGYTGCSYKRTFTKLNSTKKQMKVKHLLTTVRKEPYSDGKSVTILAKGAMLTTYGVVKNQQGQEWYILNDGNYIFGEAIQKATDNDTQNTSNNVSNGGDSGSGSLFDGLANVACKIGTHPYNMGKCVNCGDEFEHKEHKVDEVYKATKAITVKQKPYDAAASAGKTYQAGEVVPATAYTINCYGNKWYKTAEGWVYDLEDATFKSASLSLSTYTFTNREETVTPVLTILPKNAAIESITWSRENTAVAAAATVDQNGKITPVTSGKIEIYCTVKPVGQKAQKLTVLINVTKEAMLENWQYSQNSFNYDLAARCSLLASLAYPSYKYTYNYDKSMYTTTRQSKSPKTPETLTRYLIDEGYSYKISNNYYNMTEYNSPFVLAYKYVKYNGKKTPIVYVIAEGSAGKAGWQGNMKVTGPSYESGLTEHTTFEASANDMKKQLEKFMADSGIKKPIVVITGHSRGSAACNLLAQKLNNESSSYTQIMAYLFATPNCTKKPVRSSNIFNICNEGDFVAYIPFSNGEWGFQKHGRVFAFDASIEYVLNSSFREYANDSFKKSKYAEKPDYLWVSDTLDGVRCYVTGKWKTVEEYYTHNQWTYSALTSGDCNNVEAFDFFYNGLALAACGDSGGTSYMAKHALHPVGKCPFFKLTTFFAVDAKFVTNAFAHNHEMITYNCAVNAKVLKEKTDFNVFSTEEGNGTVAINESERASLYSFFNMGDNALMIEEAGWDINDPNTWSGIKWDMNGNVISIDLSYMNLSGWFNASVYSNVKDINVDGNKLTMLATASCTELENLSCMSNNLSAISVSNSENLKNLNCSFNNIGSLDVSGLSQLVDLNCHSNKLTALDLDGATALQTVRCGNNELTNVDISTNTSLSMFSCESNNIIESQNATLAQAVANINDDGGIAIIGQQKFNENYSFNNSELSMLTTFAESSLNGEKLNWDMENPWSWDGVEWKIENGEYRISSVDFDNMELEGDLDLTDAEYLKKVSCEGSSLSTINLSGCTRLESLNCYDAGLTEIALDDCKSLTEINCDENYLEVAKVESSLNQIGLNTGMATYANQNVDALEENFNQEEKDVLIGFLSMAQNYEVLGWDAELPGSWDGVTWIDVNGEYRVNGVDLKDKEVYGELDLSSFEYLETFDFGGTQIEIITLPDCLVKIPEGAFSNSKIKYVYMQEGITNIGKSAFAHCDNITSLVLPSTVAKIEDRAFYGSGNLESIVFMGDEPVVSGEEIALGTSTELKMMYFDDKVWEEETDIMSLYNCIEVAEDYIVLLSEVPQLKEEGYFNSANCYGGDDIDMIVVTKDKETYGTCIFSVYDEQGRLKSMSNLSQSMPHYMNVVTFDDVNIQYAGEEYCVVKGMFWDGVSAMNPLADVKDKVLRKPTL